MYCWQNITFKLIYYFDKVIIIWIEAGWIENTIMSPWTSKPGTNDTAGFILAFLEIID